MSDEKFTLKGPYEIDAIVHLTDGKQTAKVTIALCTGSLPTEDEVNQVVAGLVDRTPALDGFRLMTKREFFDQWCLDNYGQKFAMPGGEDWDK